MARGNGKVVGQSTHGPKFKGLTLATNSTKRTQNSFYQLFANGSSTVRVQSIKDLNLRVRIQPRLALADKNSNTKCFVKFWPVALAHW